MARSTSRKRFWFYQKNEENKMQTTTKTARLKND